MRARDSRASVVYFNIKVNQPLPADAFTFKTDSKTQLYQVEAGILFYFVLSSPAQPQSRPAQTASESTPAYSAPREPPRSAATRCAAPCTPASTCHIRGRRHKSRNPQQHIKRIQPRIGPAEARLDMVMRIHPPVQIDGQILHARPQPHIGHAAQRQTTHAQRSGCAACALPPRVAQSLASISGVRSAPLLL